MHFKIFLKLYPLSFGEFITATVGRRFAELLDSQDYPMITSFKQTYIDALRQYFFVGGMPEAVQNFAKEKEFNEVREIQKRILTAYEQDFSKHAPIEIVPKIRMIWNSIPSQLAKENKKFIYGLIREGSRAKEFETAIMWLCDCGLVHKVSRVNKAEIPLKAYEDLGIYYYTNDRGSCEVDFILDTGRRIVPVEVKAEVNLKAKSLKTYREKFNPEICIRTSMADYKKEDWLLNLPLYAIPFFSCNTL